MESRGTGVRHSEVSEAESIARRSGDAQLLCFALSARFMQTFTSAGLAADRAEIGQELITTAFDADSPTSEINGRLIRMQALCAVNDTSSASTEADAVDRLAQRHERIGRALCDPPGIGCLGTGQTRTGCRKRRGGPRPR